MFRSYSTGKPVGEILDLELDSSANSQVEPTPLDKSVPTLRRLHSDTMSTEPSTAMEIGDVLYPFHSNAIMPPRKAISSMEPHEVRRYTKLTIWLALSQRGLVVCGGDDHVAEGAPGIADSGILPIYRHPAIDQKQLFDFTRTVKLSLEGTAASVVDSMKVSEAVDLTLGSEKFAETMMPIYLDHMSRVQGRTTPTTQ